MNRKIVCFGVILGIMLLTGLAIAGEIHDAVKAGNIDKIKSLLDQNPSLLIEKDEIGKTPVHWAVGRGRIEALKLLLDYYHADANIRNNNGGTPLHVAASQAQPECARILIEHGATIDARTQNNSTPLHFAAYKGRKPGHFEVAKILIRYGADVNAETDTGATPLSMATQRKNNQMIELLNENRAKFGSSRRSGNRPGAGNYYLDNQDD